MCGAIFTVPEPPNYEDDDGYQKAAASALALDPADDDGYLQLFDYVEGRHHAFEEALDAVNDKLGTLVGALGVVASLVLASAGAWAKGTPGTAWFLFLELLPVVGALWMAVRHCVAGISPMKRPVPGNTEDFVRPDGGLNHTRAQLAALLAANLEATCKGIKPVLDYKQVRLRQATHWALASTAGWTIAAVAVLVLRLLP